jgi:hypothetical protein
MWEKGKHALAEAFARGEVEAIVAGCVALSR